jgi:hypothetical protein
MDEHVVEKRPHGLGVCPSGYRPKRERTESWKELGVGSVRIIRLTRSWKQNVGTYRSPNGSKVHVHLQQVIAHWLVTQVLVDSRDIFEEPEIRKLVLRIEMQPHRSDARTVGTCL